MLRLLLLVSLFFTSSLYAQEYADTSEYGVYYIVSVSEGNDYARLKKIEQKAARLTGLKTDELGRFYREGKGIVLPDICEDEIYCGSYYPRRPFYDHNFLSIEMLNAYEDVKIDGLDMMVMGGMFTDESSAASMVSLLKSKIPEARYFKAKVYLGCMH